MLTKLLHIGPPAMYEIRGYLAVINVPGVRPHNAHARAYLSQNTPTGSPVRDRPRSSISRHQCRSRQVPSEHARAVLGQRTTVVTETNSMFAGISVRNLRPHDAHECLREASEY